MIYEMTDLEVNGHFNTARPGVGVANINRWPKQGIGGKGVGTESHG